MSAHTTGPWSVGAPTGLVNQISIQPCIGVVYGAGDEIAANARLISAAPDMYDALKAIVYWHETAGHVDESWFDAARAALAKAVSQ